MKNSDKENARIEHHKALQKVVVDLLSDHAELFKQFSDNPSFRKCSPRQSSQARTSGLGFSVQIIRQDSWQEFRRQLIECHDS
jgi:hypothetical protein